MQREVCLGTFSERFMRENTPSRLSGMPFDEELACRQKASCMVYDAIVEIGLPPSIADRAVILLQHFYMYQSFQVIQYQLAAAVCVFIAAKMDCSVFPIEIIRRTFAELLGERYESLQSYDFDSAVLYIEANFLQVFGVQIGQSEAPASFVNSIFDMHPACPASVRNLARLVSSYSIAVSTLAVRYSPAHIAVTCVLFAFEAKQVDAASLRESIITQWKMEPTEVDSCAQILNELREMSLSCDHALRQSLISTLCCAYDTEFDDSLESLFDSPVASACEEVLERHRALRRLVNLKRTKVVNATTDINNSNSKPTENASASSSLKEDNCVETVDNPEEQSKAETNVEKPRKKVSINEYKERLLLRQKSDCVATRDEAKAKSSPDTSINLKVTSDFIEPSSKAASNDDAIATPCAREEDPLLELRRAIRSSLFSYDPLRFDVESNKNNAPANSKDATVSPDLAEEELDYDEDCLERPVEQKNEPKVCEDQQEIIALSDDDEVSIHVKQSSPVAEPVKRADDDLSEGEIVDDDEQDEKEKEKEKEKLCQEQNRQNQINIESRTTVPSSVLDSKSKQNQNEQMCKLEPEEVLDQFRNSRNQNRRSLPLTYDHLLGAVSCRLSQAIVPRRKSSFHGNGVSELEAICISSSDEENDGDIDPSDRTLATGNESPRLHLAPPRTPPQARVIRNWNLDAGPCKAVFSPPRDTAAPFPGQQNESDDTSKESSEDGTVKRGWRYEGLTESGREAFPAAVPSKKFACAVSWPRSSVNFNLQHTNESHFASGNTGKPSGGYRSAESGWSAANSSVRYGYGCLRNDIPVAAPFQASGAAPVALSLPRSSLAGRDGNRWGRKFATKRSGPISLTAFSDQELQNELQKRQHFAKLLDNANEVDPDDGLFNAWPSESY